MKSVLVLFMILFTGVDFCTTKKSVVPYNLNPNEDVLILRKLHDDYKQKRAQHKEGGHTLFTFEKKLIEILENSQYLNDELFEALNENDFYTVKSEDNKLILISWEILDNGCHHSYWSYYI